MEPVLKQRLVGAAVLVSLAIIFIPLFLDQGTERRLPGAESIPPVEPPADFNSRVVPLDEDAVEALIEAAAEPPPELPAEALEQMPVIPPETASEASESEPAVAEPEPAAAAAAAPRTGVTAWVVQLGSFSSEDNAVRLTERLRGDGFAAFIEKYQGGDSPAFRVRVGPALTREEAEALQVRIAQAVETEGIVVRYP